MGRGKDASAEYGPSQEANSGRELYLLKGYGVTGELVPSFPFVEKSDLAGSR